MEDKKVDIEAVQKEMKELFGVTDDEMEKVKSFNPTLKIELDKVYKFKILIDKPRVFDFEDTDENGQKITRTGRVLEVENLDTGEICSVWISPETLRVRIAKLYAKHGTLLNLYIKMGKKLVEHKKWGEVAMYWVSEIVDATQIESEVPPATENK